MEFFLSFSFKKSQLFLLVYIFRIIGSCIFDSHLLSLLSKKVSFY